MKYIRYLNEEFEELEKKVVFLNNFVFQNMTQLETKSWGNS